MHQLLLPSREDIVCMHERAYYRVGRMEEGRWRVVTVTADDMTDGELAVWDRVYGITDDERDESWLRP